MIEGMQHHLQIIPISAFKDNYIWLMHNGRQAVAVDPGDAKPVLENLQHLNLTLDSILITHHHHDHIGGVDTLLAAYPEAVVYAPKLETYAFKHRPVGEPDLVQLTAFDLKFSVIDLPGHTLGHIAYYATQADGKNLLFCGDTLFGAGCGRLFEGSPAQMYQSLQKLAALPTETQVYCTHEYTLNNIHFALSLEPNNQALVIRLEQTQKIRGLNKPSLPSSIALERATNPFLRCFSPEIQSGLQLKNADNLKVFSTMRELKNHY
ncbi:MAG: hydroxyacylglutathione hydrolase [Methylotenera sp.]|nr:hydroxyacylglutathione hydrolase [Methylotenera sp.]